MQSNQAAHASPFISLLTIASVVLLIFSLKLYYFGGWWGPSIFGDELLNRLYAQRIHDFASYDLRLHWVEPAYPPFYPAFLSLPLNMSDWYHGMLFLNALSLTAAPFLMFAISSRLGSCTSAVCAALVSAVIPSSLFFTPILMAENLSITIYLLAVLATLNPRPCSATRAVWIGCCLAATYLTKYVLLIFIPPLVIGFLFMQLGAFPEASIRGRLSHAFALAILSGLGFVALIALWLWYAHWSGLTIIDALGLSADSVAGPLPGDLSGLSFFLVVTFLTAFLALAPVATLLVMDFPRTATERAFAVTFALTAITAVLYFAQFSWKIYRNTHSFDPAHPPFYISQRYMLYLTLLAIPMAFIVADRIQQITTRQKFVGASVAAALGSIAVLVLVAGYVWPSAPALIGPMAPDVWPYALVTQDLGSPLYAIFLVILSPTLLLISSSFSVRRGSIVAACSALLVFVVLDTSSIKAIQPSIWSKIAHKLSIGLQHWTVTGDESLLVVDKTKIGVGLDFLAFSAMFWMKEPPLIVAGSIAQPEGNDLELTYEWPQFRAGTWLGKKMPEEAPSSIVLFSLGQPPADALIVETWANGTAFFLVRVPPERTRKSSISLPFTGPFNVCAEYPSICRTGRKRVEDADAPSE
jgi:hypothetical protein